MPTLTHHQYRTRIWRDAERVWHWEVTHHWRNHGVFIIDSYPIKTGMSPWRWQARMAARMWRHRLAALDGEA